MSNDQLLVFLGWCTLINWGLLVFWGGDAFTRKRFYLPYA